jgi:hypothetical protein
METDTWEEDIQWFLMRCAEDKRPKPSEFARDAFADKVAMRLSSCVYPGEPVLNARKETYEDYKNKKLHGCRW